MDGESEPDGGRGADSGDLLRATHLEGQEVVRVVVMAKIPFCR